MPMTAASRDAGMSHRLVLQLDRGLIHSPPDLMTSLERSVIVHPAHRDPGSRRPRCRNQPSLIVQDLAACRPGGNRPEAIERGPRTLQVAELATPSRGNSLPSTSSTIFMSTPQIVWPWVTLMVLLLVFGRHGRASRPLSVARWCRPGSSRSCPRRDRSPGRHSSFSNASIIERRRRPRPRSTIAFDGRKSRSLARLLHPARATRARPSAPPAVMRDAFLRVEQRIDDWRHRGSGRRASPCFMPAIVAGIGAGPHALA